MHNRDEWHALEDSCPRGGENKVVVKNFLQTLLKDEAIPMPDEGELASLIPLLVALSERRYILGWNKLAALFADIVADILHP